MYGLGAVALILAVILLYRFSMKRKSSDGDHDSMPTMSGMQTPRAADPTTAAPSLVGTSWKFISPNPDDSYGGILTFTSSGDVTFGNGGVTSRKFMSLMKFSNGKLSGKFGDSQYSLDVVYDGPNLIIKSVGPPAPDYKLTKV